MKIKNILIFIMAFAVILSACTKADEVSTSKDAGAFLSVEYASGKALGLPNPDNTVTFLDVALDFELIIPAYQGSSDVASYSIVKRLVTQVTDADGEVSDVLGPWVDVETVNSMPYSLSYTSISEYIQGISGVAETDLRIGNYFEFTSKINKTDGSIEWPSTANGVFTVIVSCLSDLAGTYDLTVTGTSNVNRPTEVITEVSPGRYLTTTTGGWTPAQLAPGDGGFYFTDVCGTITIEEQNLGGYWANIVAGEGAVDPATGNIYLHYTVISSSSSYEYESNYILSKKKHFEYSGTIDTDVIIDPKNVK